MPIYEYRCEACGEHVEVLQKVSDPPLSECPACERPALSKLVSAAAFHLKGTGWYVTDFRDQGKRDAASTDQAAGGESSGAGGQGAEAQGSRAKEAKGGADSTGRDGAGSSAGSSAPQPAAKPDGGPSGAAA